MGTQHWTRIAAGERRTRWPAPSSLQRSLTVSLDAGPTRRAVPGGRPGGGAGGTPLSRNVSSLRVSVRPASLTHTQTQSVVRARVSLRPSLGEWYVRAGGGLAGGALQLVGEPVETLVEAVSRGGTGRLDVPVAVPQRVQAQLVCDLRRVHGVGQILTATERQVIHMIERGIYISKWTEIYCSKMALT